MGDPGAVAILNLNRTAGVNDAALVQPHATLWSGANCTGCSYVVTADLNFCGRGYATCGTINDNVVSVSIP